MNINITLECKECRNHTNCRIGISNRDRQPLKFSCRNCGCAIGIDIRAKNPEDLDDRAMKEALKNKGIIGNVLRDSISYKITGALQVEGKQPFEPGTDFVDLHLDFPVVFGEYVPGNTPFMQAMSRIKHEGYLMHRERLRLMNENYKKYDDVSRLITMYSKGFYGPFADASRKRFKITLKSKRLEDVNAALYRIVSEYILPFTLPDDSRAHVRHFANTLRTLLVEKKDETKPFLQKLYDTDFIRNAQKDCLKIYKPIFDAELPLRPAMFLDFDQAYVEGEVPMRVSTNDFEQYREVYKDMAEVLSRQLVLVAGVNNLLKRGDHDAFAKGIWVAKNGRDLAPANLDAFANEPLGKKPLYIDDSWFALDAAAQDNKLRNAIAHSKIEYNEVRQAITYYPKLEGMAREAKEEIQLIDYMRRMLCLFREVHRLHHLVKCFNYALLLDPGASLVQKRQ